MAECSSNYNTELAEPESGGVRVGGAVAVRIFGNPCRTDVPLLCPGLFGARRKETNPLSH
jgi:hypothetical protein